jgi:hypothetical protein
MKRLTIASNRPLLLVLAGGADAGQVQLVQSIVLEHGLGTSVLIMANISEESKSALYAAADIFVALSDNLQETFGISIIEAMACGLPVVASDINGYKELVIENRTGYKIPTYWANEFPLSPLSEIMNFETMQLLLSQCMAINTELLYGRLLSLINDPSRRQAFGCAGKETVREKYLWSHIITQYEILWDSLYAQSVNFTGTVDKRDNLFCNNYLQLFAHYPTAIIGAGTVFGITKTGLSALSRQQFPIPYTDVGMILDFSSLTVILESLSQNPLSLDEIYSLQTNTVSLPALQFTLLWMTKYSLITIVQQS